MSEPDLQDIEQALGREIDSARKGAIADLHDVPRDILEDLRNLRPLTLSYRLLKHYTAPSQWRWLLEFLEDVVDRGIEPQEWRLGGILVPLFPVEALVSLEVPQVLSALEPGKHESWLHVLPVRDAWEMGEDVTGAPAVDRPKLRYDSALPVNVRHLSRNALDHLSAVDDIGIATRRWIGSRIAGAASKFGGIEQFVDSGELFKTAFPRVQKISNDAFIATRGVLHEISAMGPSKIHVPGFRGPSNWYQ